MQYRKLGKSDLNVSVIALGSWLTYGVGVKTDESTACVKKAFDCGINFIDTANIYGRGAAETFLGETLAGIDRKSFILATKLFFPMTESDRGLSRAQIEKQLDASLKRLKTDYVDLYQCHRNDPETPLDETMEALTRAVKAGKTRYLGFSEWPVDRIEAALKVPNTEPFVSSQPQYSLLWRNPEEKVIPFCRTHGISQIVWSPLAQGILTGKYKPGSKPPADSRAASEAMGGFLTPEKMSDAILKSVQDLVPIAKAQGMSVAQLALAWVLREQNVASAIIGASKPSQVEDNAKAADHTLDASTIQRIEAALAPAKAAA